MTSSSAVWEYAWNTSCKLHAAFIIWYILKKKKKKKRHSCKPLKPFLASLYGIWKTWKRYFFNDYRDTADLCYVWTKSVDLPYMSKIKSIIGSKC